MKLIICRELPASGKTSWATEYVRAHPRTVRVNRDDLRMQLFGGEFKQSREPFIIAAQNALIVAALKDGRSVVVDDTNLDPSNDVRLRAFGKRFRAEVEIQDFDVSVAECIRRDAARPNPVGVTVIGSYAAEYGLGHVKQYSWRSAGPARTCFIQLRLTLPSPSSKTASLSTTAVSPPPRSGA